MGGGRNNFLLKDGDNSTGKRLDENLIDAWKTDKQKRFSGQAAQYVKNREELMNANTSEVDYLLGKTGNVIAASVM